MEGLRGKRVVVTGASSGIGLETARLLVEHGAEVCLVARSADRLERAAAEVGGSVWWREGDVSDSRTARQLAADVTARWQHLDGLVNNAGIAPMATLSETDDRTWDEAFAVNVRGPFLLCRELHEVLEGGRVPSVVNVSSTLAERAIPGMAAYNASKAALNHLTRSLALEWAPAVRVNAVMPAVVDTPIHTTRGISAEQVAEMGELHPMRRVGQPRDVAAMIAFLLSDEASWITGTVIPVDGGMLAS